MLQFRCGSKQPSPPRRFVSALPGWVSCLGCLLYLPYPALFDKTAGRTGVAAVAAAVFFSCCCFENSMFGLWEREGGGAGGC